MCKKWCKVEGVSFHKFCYKIDTVKVYFCSLFFLFYVIVIHLFLFYLFILFYLLIKKIISYFSKKFLIIIY